MTSNQSVLVLAVGFMLAFGGVGGVENSQDSAQLLASTVLAVIGCGLMYCGVLGLKGSEYYDER